MDELLQRSPEAHGHLQSVADPELQKELGGALMQLGHVDLFEVTESRRSFEGTSHVYTPIPEVSLGPEQQEQSERAASIVARVADVTSRASELVEQRKQEVEDDHYYGSYFDIYEVAKDIALKEATDAAERQDAVATKGALETMLAVGLVSADRYGDDGTARLVREAVAAGLATDLYEAAHGMHGIIAVKEKHGSMRAISVPETLAPSADLIRVAANTDFDDQMQHPTKLVGDGMPASDVRRREEMIDNMPHGAVAALSRLAGDKLGNTDWAASLAVRAGIKLTEEYYGGSDDEVTAAADTVGVLADYGLSSSGSVQRREAAEQLDKLRELRSAGLKPYRTNSPITHVLDRAMVRLAVDGKVDAVRRLISSSSHEVPPIDRVQPSTDDQDGSDLRATEREFLDANLGWAIHTESHVGGVADRYRVHKMFAELHEEREADLRSRLLEVGADPATITAIIENSSDPDSALEIPPEFWDSYNSVTKQGSYRENNGFGNSPGDVREIIEGGQSRDLATRASILLDLVTAGVDPYDVSSQFVARAQALEEPTDRAEYIKQLATMIGFARSDEAEQVLTDRFIQTGTFIDNISRFARPEEAMETAKHLFGENAFSKLHQLASLFEPYGSRAPIMPTQEFMDTVGYLSESFGHEQCQELLSSDTLPLDRLTQLGQTGVAELTDGILKSQKLTDVVRLGFGAHAFRYLATAYGESAPLELLETVYSDQSSGIQHMVEEFGDSSQVQVAILGELFRGQLSDMQARAEQLRQYVQDAELGQALSAHPALASKILEAVRIGAHDQESVSALSSALVDEGLQVLTNEYVSSDQATVIIDRICRSVTPMSTKEDILRVYEDTDFLQERGIPIDFASHVEEWVSLLDIIPDGKEGERFKALVIKRLELSTGEDPVQAIRIFTEIVPNKELEAQMRVQAFKLIHSLLGAETTRGYPSIKPGKLAEVFFDSEIADLYRRAFLLKQEGKTEELTALIGNLQPREQTDQAEEQITLSQRIAMLKPGVAELTSQQGVAARWLREYAGQDIRAAKLIEAWKARDFALENGIKDNPTDILYFVATEGLLQYASQMIGEGKTDVTLQEIGEYRDFALHLGGRYGQQSMFGAIERMIHFKREHGTFPQKLIPAFSVPITEAKKEYTAEILQADDPRGLTIGYDTGCCMTLGGASESCIWAGYEDGRYSFIGIYDDANKLRAQSIMYVAEADGKKVLVIDNIETNQGTDLSVIASVYKKALVEMMKATNTEIDAIHIGVGFTPSAVLNGLPKATSYRTPLSGVYTDAASQRLLWSRGGAGDKSA